MTELEASLIAKIAEYEKRMGIKEHDPAKEGYLVLVGILNQQNEYLKAFNIKSKIASDDKADMAAYKNAKDLWENLPKMIENVSSLKIALKMEGEEKKTQDRPFSAKDVANGNV
jgi:hypothetical protein